MDLDASVRILRATPHQAAAADLATGVCNVYWGSVRSGKTIGVNLPWLEFVNRAPPGDLFMVGKTLRALERNVLVPLRGIVGPGSLEYSLHAGRAHLDGRLIYLESANDESSFKRILGSTCAGALVDEMTLVPENYFAVLRQRMSVPGARLFGTTNTDSPFHYLKVKYLDRMATLGWRGFRFLLQDNPYLGEDYVRQLYSENTGLFFQRYILARWVLAEGLVYTVFNPARHVVPKSALPPSFPHFDIAVDFGASNPFAALLIGSGYDARSFVLDTVYVDPRASGRTPTNAALLAEVKGLARGLRIRSVIVDPSAAAFRADLKDAGFSVVSGQNAVMPGIQAVTQELDAGRLFVVRTKRNRVVIQEFGTYIWDQKAQLRGVDQPLKANDHCLDALRYWVFTRLRRDLSADYVKVV